MPKSYLDLTGLTLLINKLRNTPTDLVLPGTHELVEHPSTNATSAGAYQVCCDSNGHVIIGNQLTCATIGAVPDTRTINSKALSSNITLSASDVGAAVAADIKNGTLTIQAEGTTKGTFSANSAADVTINFTASDFNITGALNFIGESTTDPKGSSGATVSGHTTWVKGDVVIYQRSGESGFEEYLNTLGGNTAAAWELLGDADSYALKTITISGINGLTGSGTLAGDVSISHAAGAQAATAAGAYKIGTDSYGHAILGNQITPSDISASPNTHTHSVSGSCSIAADNVVTGITDNKTRFAWGINADTTQVVTAQATDTYGHANVGSAVSVMNGFQDSGVAYGVSYDSTNERLVFTPLTPSTTNINPAVASSDTFSLTPVLNGNSTISVTNPTTGGTQLMTSTSTTKSAVSGTISGTASQHS